MSKIIAGSLLVLITLTIPVTTAFAQDPSPNVPVVILFKEKPADKHINLVKSNGGEIKRTYNIINGFAAKIPQDKIEGLKGNPLVISIDPDVEVKAFDINADTQIRADQVWAAGDTGQGVPVAILDTGINLIHPEFAFRILKCHNEIFLDPNICNDQNGHGTHVAGIAGAAGCCAVPNDAAKGVAPAVSLYIDQVLNAAGSGTISGIIAGIDWAKANGAKVISMSLGTDPISTTQPDCDVVLPSLTSAVNNAVAAGVTVVAASGNSGTAGVGAPACISSTIAVGAVDSSDAIAFFSSRGGPMSDHGIVAPGVSIFSTWLNGGYATASGTSMATPMVSGTIALMLKADSTLTPATIRSTLFGTACTSNTTPSCPTGSVPNTVYGYGRVDALRAYNAVATPQPPDFSISASPSSLTIPIGSSGSSTITVTSLNGFSSPVTLSTSTITGVTTSFTSNPVTPPSGGSATSTLTINVGVSAATGSYTLTVTGVSGSLTHTTTLTLTVTTSSPPPDFSLSTSPSSLTIQQGGSGGSTITVTSLNGFNSAVTLSLSGNPSGVTGSFSPNPVTPPSGGSATSTLTINVGVSAATGSYTLTVTGVSGSLTHTTTLTLTVTVPQLSVAVTTDKATYTRNSFAFITVSVSANATPVSGASVTLTVKDPNGGTVQGSDTTDANGKVIFKYRIGPKAPTGKYTATAQASATGFNPGTGSTTFNVV